VVKSGHQLPCYLGTPQTGPKSNIRLIWKYGNNFFPQNPSPLCRFQGEWFTNTAVPNRLKTFL
jgi:hypothetical protein